MIRINRTSVTTPPILVDEDAAGPLERRRAEAFFNRRANRKKSFPGGFKVYKHATVKEALNELFSGKCAYCESRYEAVHPMDVEHFRPKAAVVHEETLRKPGYYWLAADWDNLLPSCIDCNRARKHPTVDAPVDLELSGKANLFPISNEAQRAEFPDEELHENRLLFDPCRDFPERQFVYKGDGLIMFSSAKGRTSIEVYGLNRRELVEERRALMKRIALQMNQVNDFLKNAIRSNSLIDKTSLANGLANLLLFFSNDQAYLGLVQQIVDPYIIVMAKKLRSQFKNDVPSNQSARKTVALFVAEFENQIDDPLSQLESI